VLRKLAFIAGILALLGTAAPTFAQKTGPNGGSVLGKGDHQIELVVSPTELAVYMLSDGNPHDSKGVTLRAVVQQGGKNTTINFVDDKGKRLVAKLPAPLDKGAVVVLTGKDDHGDPLNARHVIK